MTSEGEIQKTSEFLHRRKLRIQQVREQSKDIAKIIRQRAKLEKLRQVVELDARKEKDYLLHQKKVVQKLEELYSKGLQNVGTSHKEADDLTQPDKCSKKIDLSHLRGKEAAAELKRKKQEKLDKQKEFLERKVQARKAANVLSREKSTTTASKLSIKSSSDKIIDKTSTDNKITDSVPSNTKTITGEVTKTDMASQWDAELIPSEWEPHIPPLEIPKENSVKESLSIDTQNNTDKQKRPNLFALSDEMPSSLRGNRAVNDDIPTKASLTLVSEYIQNRALRLREPEVSNCAKKKPEDLQTLKQTILRTRTPKTEVKPSSEELPLREHDCDKGFTKKKSVTLYNHSTRDSKDVPLADGRVIIPDLDSNKNAYSEALIETVSSHNQEKKIKKMRNVTNKLAVTRQHVEKEYKDTMTFLQALPRKKDTRPINIGFKGDHRLQIQNEIRQKLLQQEFKNIERASRLNATTSPANKSSFSGNQEPRKSKLPSEAIRDNFIEKDFQYSWMPVPDSDRNLAVHTIPTAVKEGKAGNSVQFSKVDSYHEYRSRHKHTPPTKDTNNYDKKSSKRFVEAVIIQQKDDGSSSSLSIASNNSSIDDLSLSPKEKKANDCASSKELTDAERIIIYKILDYKNKKHGKPFMKHKSDNAVVNSNVVESEKKTKLFDGDINNSRKDHNKETASAAGDHNIASSVGDLNEGIHKVDSEKGKCKHGNKPTSKSHSPTIIHPSASESANSFKTATNSNTDYTSKEDGHIKFTDKVEQEKGNFYIGASGFLKDDAYEVIIQLRKKGIIEEQEKKHDKEESIPKKNPISNKEIITEHKSESGDCMQEKAINNDGKKYLQVVEYPQESAMSKNPVHNLTDETVVYLSQNMHSGNLDSEQSRSSNHTPTKRKHASSKHDRSVSTPLQEDPVVPSHIQKTDPIPKAAPSSYTQTTFNSPNPLPAFLHMSSSTSTAYMSPPEVVLPNFFRKGYGSCNESYQDDDFKHKTFKIPKQQHYCKKYSKCRCRRCLRTISAYLKQTPTEQQIIQLTTPPNTAQTFESDKRYDFSDVHNNKKVSSHSIPATIRRNQSSRRLKTKSNSNLYGKHHSCKSKRVTNKFALTTRNTAALNNNKSKVNIHASKKNNKSFLDPAIRAYINKLLCLNREGIKAIQIINQECSTINTPASSIINIPSNFHISKTDLEVGNQISLEQIKNILRRQIMKDFAKQPYNQSNIKEGNVNNNKLHKRNLRKKLFHKVKSLNISKKILVNACSSYSNKSINKPADQSKNNVIELVPVVKIHGHNPVPDNTLSNRELSNQNKKLDKVDNSKDGMPAQSGPPSIKIFYEDRAKTQYISEELSELPKTILSSESTSSDSHVLNIVNENQLRQPINISTQTYPAPNDEINFMKLAEDKLQNMDKIADLTEKCTIRLSNLAKVLEEVRKNKFHAYSQISSSDSTDSDQKMDKVLTEDMISIVDKPSSARSPNSTVHVKDSKSGPPPITLKVNTDADYESLLVGIPKPQNIKSPRGTTDYKNGLSDSSFNKVPSVTSPLLSTNIEAQPNRINNSVKCRSKPPPALLRIHLKRPQENVVPHELSTVIEVDSPMSVKLKNKSSNIDNINQSSKNFIETRKKSYDQDYSDEENEANPEQGNVHMSSNRKIISPDSSDDSNLQMLDLHQFNEIMLKPFISLQEYAKDYHREAAVSKRETVNKNNGLIDDISSFNSDGSLPDVVAELLKRKLITEPFKFDTASNVNSTTISSESTLSVLALSKVQKDKTKYKIAENNGNNAETSDTLSISSNPDLENAFKKLGMGWASSTLKKTKERLALSSSSNTSSSSLSQFKFKNSVRQDIPMVVTDSVSSVLLQSKRSLPDRQVDGNNVEQQTSLTNSMTVKEFLTNELAKKITFTNKTSKNDTHEEFVSLIETKLPEEFKNSSQTIIEQHSGDSVPSGNNRARTSTPVQIFKSVTYHSSSSSNMSNGLFSNADDLSSVKLTSTSMRYHSTSEKDELTIPNCSLKLRKGPSDGSKTDSC